MRVKFTQEAPDEQRGEDEGGRVDRSQVRTDVVDAFADGLAVRGPRRIQGRPVCF